VVAEDQAMKALLNKTQHQLRADEFQIPLLLDFSYLANILEPKKE
jgi:hypothetical protein